MKCQGWGHLSYDCKLMQDTCRTCAGWHRTANCTSGSQPRCVSCGTEGHASWSRSCPIFIRKCEEMDGRLTENAMLYFLTNEPWTHVMQPPKLAYHPPPPTVTHHSDCPPSTFSAFRGSYRQSTLQFPHSQRRPHGGTQPSHAPASTQGQNNNAPPVGAHRGGPEWLGACGDSDPMNKLEGLPDISSL